MDRTLNIELHLITSIWWIATEFNLWQKFLLRVCRYILQWAWVWISTNAWQFRKRFRMISLPVPLDFTRILIWLMPNNRLAWHPNQKGQNIFKRFNIPEERADFCEGLTEIGAFTNRWALTNLESSQLESIWGITRQYLADNDTNTRNRLFSHWFSVTWLCGLDGFQTSTKWDF